MLIQIQHTELFPNKLFDFGHALWIIMDLITLLLK
jgi:hypothetical protein